MSRNNVGRHRDLDGDPDAQAALALPPDPPGPFTVQWLNGRWFIGNAGAAQRIEDGPWLDAWLAADGATGRADLDFGGDLSLEQRFVFELGLQSRTEDPT
jgi:hypothetical protein